MSERWFHVVPRAAGAVRAARSRRRHGALCLCAAFAWATTVGASAEPRFQFADATADSDIDVSITCGRDPSTEILEVNGGGIGLIDFDNDGDLDVFIANGATMDQPKGGPGCKLFENLGEFKFRDVTKQVGIDVRHWATGVTVADYDGDGFDDIFVACYGSNVLLRNDAGKRFVDVTQAAGLGDARWATGCAFGDLDLDGDLDLYVVNYLEFDTDHPPSEAGRTQYKGVTVMRGPHGLTPQQDVLYENRGDGTFRDITEDAGCTAPHPAYGLNVVILDFDNDGLPDILVGNDSNGNFLFRNKGGLRFEDIGLLSGISLNSDGAPQATMGMAITDVDDNGLPDVFTTNFSSDTNTLHTGVDGQFFDDETRRYGLGLVSRPFLGWAAGFYDFDLDGDEDLLIANGHVYPEARTHNIDSDYEQPLLLFERKGNRFHRVDPPAGGRVIHEPRPARNLAFGDLDGDGDIDAVLGSLNAPVRVIRNDAPAGDWLIVALRDERRGGKNPRGIGSRIEVMVDGKSQRRWLYGGGGFQSASATYAHFGFAPKADGPRVATVRVVWPDGEVQRIDRLALKQTLTVRRTAPAAAIPSN